MNKVKRKQIYYEGSENQYIKGNGELGDFSDEIVYCTFTKNDTSTLHGDGTITMNAAEIYDALEKGKTVICKYEFNQYHESKIIELNVANVNVRDYISDKIFIIDFTTTYNHTIYVINVLWRGTIDYNTFNAWNAENDSWDGDSPLPNELYNVQDQSATINQNIKTFNDEYIDTDGNSNLHDGFYFPNAIQDYDGNWYGAVVVGNQVWLAENLRTTHFSNGTAISEGDALSETPAYQDKSSSNIPLQKRGLYYNLYAVLNGSNPTNNNPSNIQGVAPEGFHIPSLSEFEELKKYLSQQNRYYVPGYGKDSMKTIASVDYWTIWNPINGAVAPGYKPEFNNKSGLNIFPTGKLDEGEGTSYYLWTVTNGSEENKAAYFYGIDSHRNQTMARFVVSEDSCENYTTYFPVRCISNLNPTQFRNWYIKQYGSLQHHLDENSSSETPTPVNVGNGSFTVKSDDTTVSSFSANQESNESINFKGGIGITLEPDTENNAITVSAESNHTVINRQTILTAEHGQTLRYYDVRCDLNGSVLKVGDLSDFVSSDKAYSYENKYVWTKQAGETGKYAGICKVQSTEGKYVFKIDFYDSTENKTTTHFFGVVADSPADATFTFISTCNWEIIVRLNSENHRLLAYLKIPDEFVGTITLTPLRRIANSMNDEGLTSSFDYSTGTTIRDYFWYTELTQNDGVQNVNTVTELAENAPETSSSSSGNYLRTPTGNYYVNVMGDFGGNLQVDSKVSDSVINDYYIHTIEKRLQDFATAAAIYTLLNLPQPTAGDEGKMLIVNSSGQYELINPNNTAQ